MTSGSAADVEKRAGRGCRACIRVNDGTEAAEWCVCASDGRASRGTRADVRFAGVSVAE